MKSATTCRVSTPELIQEAIIACQAGPKISEPLGVDERLPDRRLVAFITWPSMLTYLSIV